MSNNREVHDFVSQNYDAIRELADNLWRQYRNRGGYRGQMVSVYDDPNYYVAFAAVKSYKESTPSASHNRQKSAICQHAVPIKYMCLKDNQQCKGQCGMPTEQAC